MAPKAAAKPKSAKPKAERLPRKAIVLTDASDSRLTFVAGQTKDGKFRSLVIHRIVEGDKPKSRRGMVELAPTFNAAIDRAERLAADAQKLGWKVKERKAKTPPFTSLPAPR